MKIKTSELIGPSLDWVVAVCRGISPFAVKKRHSEGWLLYEFRSATRPLEYSTSWAQGGPIIDREDITWSMSMGPEHSDATRFCAFSYKVGSSKAVNGPTKLIAAMRCYVASKLGDEVDVPEELLK